MTQKLNLARLAKSQLYTIALSLSDCRFLTNGYRLLQIFSLTLVCEGINRFQLKNQMLLGATLLHLHILS